MKHANALKNDDITYKNPGMGLAFLMVDRNGEDYRYVNAINGRALDFWWERWGQFKQVLKPYSIHCFLLDVYTADTNTGNGFKPKDHICTFNNLEEAQAVNYAYLELCRLWNDTATAEETKNFTLHFAKRLRDWCALRNQANELLIQEVQDVLYDKASKEMFQYAHSTQRFALDLEEDYEEFFFDAIGEIAELDAMTPLERNLQIMRDMDAGYIELVQERETPK